MRIRSQIARCPGGKKYREWHSFTRRDTQDLIVNAAPMDAQMGIAQGRIRHALTSVRIDSGSGVLEIAETHLSDAPFKAAMSAVLLVSRNSLIASETLGVSANVAYAFTVRTTADGTVNLNQRSSSEKDSGTRDEGGLLGSQPFLSVNLTVFSRLEMLVSTASELPLPPVSFGSLHAGSEVHRRRLSFCCVENSSSVTLEMNDPIDFPALEAVV